MLFSFYNKHNCFVCCCTYYDILFCTFTILFLYFYFRSCVIIIAFKLAFLLFYNKEIIFVNQIHSSKIFIFDNIYPNDIKADGIITKNKNVLLGILTADCAPIILLGNEYFGILHVGWRGLLGDIILNAVNLFIKRGEKKENNISNYNVMISQ